MGYGDLGLVLQVQKMWGDHGSLAHSLSYSFAAVDYGVLIFWPPLGMPMTLIDMSAAWQGSLGKHRNIAFWLCHIAFFGVFGKNGILEVMRDVNGIS